MRVILPRQIQQKKQKQSQQPSSGNSDCKESPPSQSSRTSIPPDTSLDSHLLSDFAPGNVVTGDASGTTPAVASSSSHASFASANPSVAAVDCGSFARASPSSTEGFLGFYSSPGNLFASTSSTFSSKFSATDVDSNESVFRKAARSRSPDSEDDRKVAALPKKPRINMGGGGKLIGPPPTSSSPPNDEIEVRRRDEEVDPAMSASLSVSLANSCGSVTASARQDDDDDTWQESLKRSSVLLRGETRRLKSGRAAPDGHAVAGSIHDPATQPISEEDYSQYAYLLRTKRGLEIHPMEGDGNCLFRAISLQVYGDPSMHAEVRRRCLDFMEKEKDHFRHFVADENFEQYLQRKRMDGQFGNHAEIQAVSELYNRSVEVYVPDNGVEPINIFHTEYKNQDVPIRLSYHDGNHYNAVIDPLVPTAGLGLGLPGLQPGLADKMQLEQAKNESDETVLQEKMRLALEESDKLAEEEQMRRAVEQSAEMEMKQAVKESELAISDMYKKKALYLSEIEAADFDLEQAVLASSLESYKQAEQERKLPSSRRVEGRRKRYNASPSSPPQRSSSGSPVNRSPAGDPSNPSIHYAAAAAPPNYNNEVASFPPPFQPSHPSTLSRTSSTPPATDEYPQSVQELVVNGFELSKVLHAYDLIGDNFDDLLSFLLSSDR